MPQILASGFVSLDFFGTVTTVGLFFPFNFFHSTQVSSQHGLFTQAGKDSGEAKSNNVFLPCAQWQDLIEWPVVSEGA